MRWGDISGLVGACNWEIRGLQTGDLEAPPNSRWGRIRQTVGVGWVGWGWVLPGLGKERVTEGQLLPRRLSVGGQNAGPTRQQMGPDQDAGGVGGAAVFGIPGRSRLFSGKMILGWGLAGAWELNPSSLSREPLLSGARHPPSWPGLSLTLC